MEQPVSNCFYLVALDHALEVKFGGSALYRVNEGVLHMGTVDESAVHHLRNRMWGGEKLQHFLVTATDDRGKCIEALNEISSALNHTTMMKRDVKGCILVSDLGETALKLIEIAPGVAVIGSETGEVDIGTEKHAATDPKARMAPGMAG